jgi:NAD(P)-dependent dehydrogenase (short-subunit alcohol dehydrogenase family)
MNEVQKVAIVTGASQGIGAGIVAAYRKQGWAVIANSRSMPPSDDPAVVTVSGDVADPATAERIVHDGLEKFGRIDTLINNAGLFVAKPFTEYTAEDYATVVGVNLTGFFTLTQRVIDPMLEHGGGHIVSITTTLVEHPNTAVPSVLASLTKGGVTAATKSLAVEYASRGIRVNAVSPGIIQTPMHAEETHDFLAGLHPMGHMGTIEDIVKGVVYLESSPFVTGEILHVDGGQSAGH